MRILTLSIAAAFLLIAAPASAQLAPGPQPIHTKIDNVPMAELSEGGGGLPFLGSSTSYNAGDWENALRTYHDSGVYQQQIAQIDAIADQTVRRDTRDARAARAR